MPCPEGRVAKLTNSWELLAEHDVQNARTADLGLHQHHAGMIGNHLSDHGSFAAQRVLTHALDNFIRCFSGNDRDQLALVGHVERIESQYFAGALDSFADWNSALLQQHSDLQLDGNFIQGGSYAAASWIAQAADSGDVLAAHHFTRAMESPALAFNRPFKLQVLPLRHGRHAVIADESAEDDLVARTRAV